MHKLTIVSKTGLALFLIQLMPLAWLVVTFVSKVNDDSVNTNEIVGGYLVYIYIFFIGLVSTLPMALGTLLYIFALTMRLSKFVAKSDRNARALNQLAKPWISFSLFAIDLIMLPKEGVWAGSTLITHIWVIGTLALIWLIYNFKLNKAP